MNQTKKIQIKYLHWIFTAMYTIIGFSVVVAPLIAIGYETTTKQSGALGFTMGIAFLLITVLIYGNQNNNFKLHKPIMTIIVIACCVSFAFTCFPISNIGIILISKCPSLTTTSVTVTVNETNNTTNTSSLVLLSEKGNELKKNDDAESKYQHDIDSFCANRTKNIPTLHFIENKIANLLEKNEKIKSSGNNGDKIHTRTVEEDKALLLQLVIKQICDNEKGFAIGWLCLLSIIQCLNIATIFVYSWILHMK